MRLHLKRRWLVRILSFSIALIVGLLGAVLQINGRFIAVERQLVHRYQAALEELSSSMNSMKITLEKSLYTGTAAGLSTLTNELVLEAGNAGAALASLPIDQQSVQTVSKFLSQVSDYSLSLTKRVVNGGTVTEQERKNLIALAEVAENLSTRLDEAKTLYNDSGSWEESIRSALSGAETLSGIDTSLTDAEESLGDYPTLIYDGPFSDHIQNKESELLKSAEEISLDKAKETAAEALALKTDQITDAGEEDGTMPAYVFSYDGGSIAVTKQGGYVIYFRREREISEALMSYEQAVQKAKEYINAKDMGAFSETYYFTDEGICVVNFAYKQGDTICYTDLIKVGVAMDNGEVVFYEARGYLMNHHKRTLKVPEYTAETAEQVLSPHLKVENIALAIIPSGGEKELYCYEFHCTGDEGEEVLVYINTETLAEEQILILLKTDGGTLTK